MQKSITVFLQLRIISTLCDLFVSRLHIPIKKPDTGFFFFLFNLWRVGRPGVNIMCCSETACSICNFYFCLTACRITLAEPSLRYALSVGVACGVTVSTSAFLACHQCYCAGSSLTWGLNLQALVCGVF